MTSSDRPVAIFAGGARHSVSSGTHGHPFERHTSSLRFLYDHDVTVDDADNFVAYVHAVRPERTGRGPSGGDPLLPIAKLRLPETARGQSYVVESPQDVGAAIEHFLSGDHANGRAFARLLRIKVADSPWVSTTVERALDESPEQLMFDDGSSLSMGSFGNSRNVRPIEDDSEPVDIGVALLEPITAREYAGIERLLQQLWDAAATESLTDAQEAQIIAVARLIEDQHRATVPGETERWKLVGTVRAGLGYLFREAPKDVLAWWKIGELLAEVDWHHILHG